MNDTCTHQHPKLYRFICRRGTTHLVGRCPACDCTLARPLVARKTLKVPLEAIPIWRDHRLPGTIVRPTVEATRVP